jgi:hypothetical protein
MDEKRAVEPKIREEKLKRGRAIIVPAGATIMLPEGLTSVRLVIVSSERVKHFSLSHDE